MPPHVKCHSCGKTFARQWTLKRHLETHSSTRSKFGCDLCNESFSRIDLRRRHRQEQHQDEQDERRPCQDCGRTFKRKSYLETHRETCRARQCFQPQSQERQLSTAPLAIKWQENWTSDSGMEIVARPPNQEFTLIRSQFSSKQSDEPTTRKRDSCAWGFLSTVDESKMIITIAEAIKKGRVRDLKRIVKALPPEWQSWTKIDQLSRRYWEKIGTSSEGGGESPFSLMGHAAKSGHVDCVRYFMRFGLSITELDLEEEPWEDPDYNCDLQYGFKGMFPLHYAAEEGRVNMIKFLLDCGANIEAALDHNHPWTALSVAVRADKVEAVRLLMDRGANDMVWYDWLERSLLLGALWNDRKDVTKLLIEHGMNINSSEDDECNPLHAAIEVGNLEAVEMLLAREANIDRTQRVSSSRSHLRHAVLKGHNGIAKLLIEHGMDDT